MTSRYVAAEESVAWLTRRIRAHVRHVPRRLQLSAAAGYCHETYEASVTRLGNAGLDCRAGCGACCRMHVGAEPAEAFAVARHLRASRSPEELSEVGRRLGETAARVARMDPAERWRARIPCVFLDEQGSCAIYPARPLACRGFTSTDVAACGEAFANGDHDHPIPGDRDRMAQAILLRRALAAATARALEAREPPLAGELHALVFSALEQADELVWLRTYKGRGINGP